MSDNCKFFGAVHGVQCPAVKAIEYYENGSIKRVEYKTASDFPPASVHPPILNGFRYEPGYWYEGPKLTGVANSYG